MFDEEETGKKVSDSEPSVKLTLLLVVCAFSQQRKTPKLLFFPLLRDCRLRDSGPQRSCVRQLTILDVLSFSPFFFFDISQYFLWEICPKKKFERLSRVRPLLCDGRVEVSTTARTKTTTVVNRTCELIRNQIFSSRTNGKKRRENTERRAERAVQKRQKESAERITHRRSIHSFVVFDGPKKKKISASSFLVVVFGFLPPEFLTVTRYRQFY